MGIAKDPGDPRHSFQYPRPDDKAIFVLVEDDGCRDLILEGLGTDSPVTVTRTPLEARKLLGDFGYRLVIVTNFGVPPKDAVFLIPRDHSYPVLFISGYFDAGLRRE